MQSPDIVPLVDPAELERLASALRSLPQVGPDPSPWTQIAPLLQAASAQPRNPRPQARWIPVAAAASLALVSGWFGFAPWNGRAPAAIEGTTEVVVGTPAVGARQPAPSATQIALIQRSGSLERWLVDSGSAQWPQDIGSASASVEIENLIANVDQRLTRSGNDAERNQLWQRRVGLLEQLVTLQGEPLALSMPNASAPSVL